MRKRTIDEKKGLLFCVVILSILFVVLLTTFDFSEPYWHQQGQEIQRHYQQWAEQKIGRYQIGIRWTGIPVKCEQELIVENNHIEKVVQNTCQSLDTTIENLFSLVTKPVEAKQCGINGPFIMDVVYDTKYGFPKIARSAFHPEERWRFQNKISDWLSFDLPCKMSGNFITAWEINVFTPLK